MSAAIDEICIGSTIGWFGSISKISNLFFEMPLIESLKLGDSPNLYPSLTLTALKLAADN